MIGQKKGRMETSYRSHTCGCIREKDIGKEVILVGWVRLLRDHGGAKFVDLCDREGCIQIVFDPNTFKDMKRLENIGREYIIQVKGTVRKRPPGTEEPSWPTGNIEVLAKEMMVISKSKTPPFELIEEKKRFLPSEEIRLKWRYLDLRRREMIANIRLRHNITKIARKFFWDLGFWEIETPYLVKHTPEGARDFVVPVRALPGRFYSLPQSPQLYKQLLMIAGLDRYFQIARCFRDEDLREDRQPEFTQIDIEMSFIKADEIMTIVESLVKKLWSEILGINDIKFHKITYKDAIEKYGSDKCDLRYGMEIRDITEIVKETDYQIFKSSLRKGYKIKCICAKGLYSKGFSKKDAQQLIDYIIRIGGKGLTWIIVKKGKLLSFPASIARCFSEKVQKSIIDHMDADDDDILFFVADKAPKCLYIMGKLRRKLGEDFGLDKLSEWSFVWITDPPYFERDIDGRILNKPSHHPFTAPKEISLDYLKRPKEDLIADAFDLIINGVEVGGGSMRIHDPDVQREIFRLLGYNEREMMEKFGFLIRALEYGAPPHGGFALGLDRLAMIMGGGNTIRDFIAFPKTKNFQSLVDDAPIPLSDAKLQDLGIIVLKEVKKND